MSSFARRADKHVCPLPGHITTVIGCTDIDVNFTGVACVGDVCGCGAVIITGFPSIQLNGRPMAHLGSATSHGGRIAIGGGKVCDGFDLEVISDAMIVNFALLDVFEPDGSVDEMRMAALLADPMLVQRAAAANALIGRISTFETEQSKRLASVAFDSDLVEHLAAYVASEINRNFDSPAVWHMKELNRFNAEDEYHKYMALPLYLRLGSPPNFVSLARRKKVKALAIWTERVSQNQPWDQRSRLRALSNEFVKRNLHIAHYLYDVLSNIHYGYVGLAGGFSGRELLDDMSEGVNISNADAGFQERDLECSEAETDFDCYFVTHHSMEQHNDWARKVAIEIGMKLYGQYIDGGITAQMIKEEISMIPAWKAR